MIDYVARYEDSQTYLTSSDQMDKYLKEGLSIYRIIDDEKEELIASPELGYVQEKPLFPVEHRMVKPETQSDEVKGDE